MKQCVKSSRQFLISVKAHGHSMFKSRSFLQEIGVTLGTNAEGGVQFTVTNTVEEAQDAARALQVSTRSDYIVIS